MNNTSRVYLDFVTDLRRSALCLFHGKAGQAERFLIHADILMKQQVLREKCEAEFGRAFVSEWDKAYAIMQSDPTEDQMKKLADKVLTLSSIVLLRVVHQQRYA